MANIKQILFSPVSINEIFPINSDNVVIFKDFADENVNSVVSAIRYGDDGSAVDISGNFSMTGNWLFMKNLWLAVNDTPFKGHFRIDIIITNTDLRTESINVSQDII